MRLKSLAVVLAILLAGCGPKPEAARHTVEEYRANKVLRKTVFRECLSDPGTRGQTPDCINAREAERLESHGSLRDSGPIGLDSKKKH